MGRERTRANDAIPAALWRRDLTAAELGNRIRAYPAIRSPGQYRQELDRALHAGLVTMRREWLSGQTATQATIIYSLTPKGERHCRARLNNDEV